MEGLAGRIVLLWGWRRALAATAAGAFAVLALAPYNVFAACFVSFPVLVWLLDGAVAAPRAGLLRRLSPSFAIGWFFGFGYFLAGLWWIGKAFLVEAEEVGWLMPFVVLGLCAYLALFYGLAATLARLLWSDGIGRIFALAAAFGLCEWLRGVVLTGFPWNAIGYAAMPTPLLMQSAAVLGVRTVTILAVLVFAMPALLAGSARRAASGLALAALLILAHAGYGFVRLGNAPGDGAAKLPVRIVQLSVDQREKWDPNVRQRIFDAYLHQSGKPAPVRPDLVIWPETAMPFLPAEHPEAMARIGTLLGGDQTLLAGAVRAEGRGETRLYYNSLVMIGRGGTILDAADKVDLVPGGEFMPLQGLLRRLGIDTIVGSGLSFTSGSSHRLLTLPGGLKALPLICYEVIFEDVGGQAAKDADLIINVTNDDWFGDTPGPYQHLRQAQLQAVESGLPLIRAAGNGVSALIDPYGRIRDGLRLDAVGTLDGSVDLSRASIALPWDRGYNWLLIFFALSGVAAVISARPRRHAN